MGPGRRVIAAVEEFFGEELDATTHERAQSLDVDAREALRQMVDKALLPRPDDARPNGHVRPFVFRSYGNRIMLGTMTMRSGYVQLPRIEHLLLYFHSVAVFDTLAPALA